MSQYSRREFLKTSLAVGAMSTVGTLPLHAAPRTATDLVPLGKSGLQVTRLAFGTGSNNGRIQAALGQQEFTRQVRYAYDHGIRFFETCDTYATPAMLGEALKGLPRDSYQLMSKLTTNNADPQTHLEQMLRISQTEYYDIMLLHWQHTPDWVTASARWQDGVLQAQEKKIVRVRGASVHGLPALRQMPGNKWLQIAMIRMNHTGTRMDGPIADNDNNDPAEVNEVVEHTKQVKKEGMGVISMKLIGEGTFTRREDRQAAMRFAFNHAGVDCVTVGFKNTREIDEAIENLNLALA
ncbi:MAG: aldo/keto reductase [Acidobacteriaceae bacterium]